MPLKGNVSSVVCEPHIYRCVERLGSSRSSKMLGTSNWPFLCTSGLSASPRSYFHTLDLILKCLHLLSCPEERARK
ncbi:hypothetical protein CapIbe_015983 [Capra ibex]